MHTMRNRGMAYEAAKRTEIGYMDEVRRIFGAYKETTFERLQIGLGDRVLDVGCGPGDDASTLARWVGATGEVVAVDKDEAMLAEARVRAGNADPAFTVVAASVYDLPFESAYFDACRADRVFQHLDAPEQALTEMRRVTKTGGIVLVFDVDWETLSVASTDIELTRRILNLGSDLHRNGPAARHLYGQFMAQHFADVRCETLVSHTTDWEIARWAFGLEHYAIQAQEQGIITADARERWINTLAAQGAADTFFASISAAIVYGRK